LIFPPLMDINTYNAFMEITCYMKNLVFVEQMLRYFLPITDGDQENAKQSAQGCKKVCGNKVSGTEPYEF